jgi:predicted transcriptional regulator
MSKLVEKLFGGDVRVRILRYFLSHKDDVLTIEELVDRLKLDKKEALKEIKNLKDIGFLEELEVLLYYEGSRKAKSKVGIGMQKNFELAEKLSELLLDFRLADRERMAENIKKFGKVKLFCIGGVFIDGSNNSLDILVVGDNLNRNGIEKYIQKLEAEFGTELNFAIFETDEFKYRVSMYDRFLRDFFQNKHENIIEKIPTKP